MRERTVPQINAVFIGLAALMYLLAACGTTTPPTPTPTPPPPVVTLVVNPPDIKDLLPGQTVPINADSSGQDISFKWTVTRGVISSVDAPAVIYTAPDSPGIDIVTVEVYSSSGTTTKSVSFNVVTPQPTTPVPTPVASSATAPPTVVLTPGETDLPAALPLECRHPAITSYVFPDLAEIAGQRAFYGPIEESPEVFKCGGVRDNVHSDPVSIKIEYNAVPGTDKYGFFGFGTLGGFDATQYRQLCLWAYVEQPDQAFRIKMKDAAGTENGVDVTVQESNKWDQICADLRQFAQLGIDLSKLENINLGFEHANGSATVWVDDFQLIK